jgi:MFS family permease
MISFFDFGSSFVFDIPQSLSTAFCDLPSLKICGAQNGQFYSAYSLPNLFIVLAGGYLLHQIGHKKCLIIYSILVNLGIAIFTLGALKYESFTIMYIGRVIGGMGAENLMITQYYCTTLWCKVDKGRGLAFALGLNQSFSFLASIIGFYTFPHLYLSSGDIKKPLLVGMAGPVLSIICVFVYVLISSRFGMTGHGIIVKKESVSNPKGKKQIKFKVYEFNCFFLAYITT